MDYIPKCPLVIAFTTCVWKHTSGVRVQPKGLLSTSFVILTYCRKLIRITLNCWKKCSNISQIQAWCDWLNWSVSGLRALHGVVHQLRQNEVPLSYWLWDSVATETPQRNTQLISNMHRQDRNDLFRCECTKWFSGQKHSVCVLKGHTSRCWFGSPRRLCGCVHHNHEDWILILTVPPPGRRTRLYNSSPKPCMKLSCESWRRDRKGERMWY